jgi:hypothetical protein
VREIRFAPVDFGYPAGSFHMQKIHIGFAEGICRQSQPA